MIALTISSFLLLSILVLVVIIKEKWNAILIAIIIPFLLFNIAFSWKTINDLWGQPKKGLPDDTVEFTILFSKVQKPSIYLLISRKDIDYPVYHTIPWTKQNEEALQKGERAKKEGKKMVAKKKKTQNNNDVQLELYEWNHLVELPKD